jgi:hypothetical protein
MNRIDDSQAQFWNSKCLFLFVRLCVVCASALGSSFAATEVFFSPSQTATAMSNSTTSTTFRSGSYEFTYSVDGYWAPTPGGTPTGRYFSVFWPDGIQAQAITAGPDVGAGANILIKRIDGKPFDLQSFTGKLLANTAGAGGAFEIMPLNNGEDALADPAQYNASGYSGQSFAYVPNLIGYEFYKIHLWVDFALTALSLNYTGNTTVTTAADPVVGGTASGGGSYPAGTDVTVTASANPGYVFVNWTEGAVEVSQVSDYLFVAEADRALVAHFAPAYTINATVALGVGGNINGMGSYAIGGNATLVATPDAGYAFQGWSLNGTIVSTSPTYTFLPGSDLVFEATFALIIPQIKISAPAPDTLTIEWPESLPGWQLEESPDLSPGSWTPSVLPVTVGGGSNQVSSSISAGTLFFRLTHP